MNKSNFELTFIYGLDGVNIDSRTLLTSLDSFISIIENLNYELDPENRLEITIEPFQPGSFWVKLTGWYKDDEINKEVRGYVIALFISLFTPILVPSPVPTPIQETTTVTAKDEVIVSLNGNTFTIPRNKLDAFKKFRSDPFIDESFKKAFSVLNDDEKVKSLTVVLDSTLIKKEIVIQRNEFPKFLESKVKKEEVTNHSNVELKLLTVYKDFDKKYGLFIWGENIILAKFDNNIYTINRVKLQSGNNIVVSLKETKQNDLHTNLLIHRTYEITGIL